MAAERLWMRCVKEFLRQQWLLKRTHREVARGLGINSGCVSGVVTRAVAMAATRQVSAIATKSPRRRRAAPIRFSFRDATGQSIDSRRVADREIRDG